MEWLIGLLVVLGAAFMLLGSIALIRLPDALSRLHGPTKATTVGLGSLIMASMLYSGWQGEWRFQSLLIAAFVFITAPISAQLISQLILHQQGKLEQTKSSED